MKISLNKKQAEKLGLNEGQVIKIKEGIGPLPRELDDKGFDALFDIATWFAEPNLDMYSFGEWVGDTMVTIAEGPIMGDYSKSEAQNDLDNMIKGFNSVKKRL